MVCIMCGGANNSHICLKIHTFVKTVGGRSYFRNALLKSRTTFLLLPFNPEILAQLEILLVSSISTFMLSVLTVMVVPFGV